MAAEESGRTYTEHDIDRSHLRCLNIYIYTLNRNVYVRVAKIEKDTFESRSDWQNHQFYYKTEFWVSLNCPPVTILLEQVNEGRFALQPCRIGNWSVSPSEFLVAMSMSFPVSRGISQMCVRFTITCGRDTRKFDQHMTFGPGSRLGRYSSSDVDNLRNTVPLEIPSAFQFHPAWNVSQQQGQPGPTTSRTPPPREAPQTSRPQNQNPQEASTSGQHQNLTENHESLDRQQQALENSPSNSRAFAVVNLSQDDMDGDYENIEGLSSIDIQEAQRDSR